MNPIFSLRARDFFVGGAMAVISAILGFLYDAINMPDFLWAHIDYKHIGILALGAFITYIIKNFLTSGTDGSEKIIGIPVPKS